MGKLIKLLVEAIVWAWCPCCMDRTDHERRNTLLICLECGHIQEEI